MKKFLVLISIAAIIFFDMFIVKTVSYSNDESGGNQMPYNTGVPCEGQLKSSPWPGFKRDIRHTGRSPYGGPANPGLKWTFSVKVSERSGPSVDTSGTIYCGSGKDEHSMYAINPDGTIKWIYTWPTSDSSAGVPAIDCNGTIYLTQVGVYESDWAGRIHAVDPNGTLKWVYKVPNAYGTWMATSVAVDLDGTIYIPDFANSPYRGGLSAINHDGTLKWYYGISTSGGERDPKSAIAIDEDLGRLYFGASCKTGDNRVLALNRNGELLWSYDTGGPIPESPALGKDGTVYFGSMDGRLYAVDPNGALKWSHQTGGEIVFSPMIGWDDTVYCGSADGHLYAVDPNGTLKWSFQTGDSIFGAGIVDINGNVYVGSYDGYLYSFTPDGSLRWKFLTGGRISSYPALAEDGTIYFISTDGYLYALQDPSSQKPQSLRGRWERVTDSPPSTQIAVYDSKNKQGIAFCSSSTGSLEKSTWRWDGNNWESVQVSQSPPYRVSAGQSAAAYDDSQNRLLLYGGWRKSDYYYTDFWGFEDDDWYLINSSASPGNRHGYISFDSDRFKLVLFGGNYYQTMYGDTWEWNGQTWTRVSTTGPPPRWDHTMVYDKARKVTLLFGGEKGYTSSVKYGDTWTWDGQVWSKITETGPSPRARSAMVYDPQRQRVVLFGGLFWEGGTPRYNDTWEWDGQEWHEVSIDGNTPAAGSGYMFFDESLGKAVLVQETGTWVYHPQYACSDLFQWHMTLTEHINDIHISDLDRDGSTEILVGTDNGVRVVRENGISLLNINTPGRTVRVCAADFDGDGLREIVTGTDSADLGTIYVYDINGNLLWSFQTGAEGPTGYWPDNKMTVRVIVADDLDGDMKDEIITGSVHYQWFPARICVLGEGGNIEGQYWHPGHVGGMPPQRGIQIMDIDNDGDPEVGAGFVNNDYGFEGAIALFEGDNIYGEAPSAANGWNFNAGSQIWYWHSDEDSTDVQAIYMFDINNNGYKEIIAGSSKGKIYALDYNENLLWSYDEEIRSVFSTDLDGDSYGEVLGATSNGKVYCFNYDGSVNWTYQTAGIDAYISFAGDIDNDGMGEVIAVSDKTYVLSREGTLKSEHQEGGVVKVNPKTGIILAGKENTLSSFCAVKCSEKYYLDKDGDGYGNPNVVLIDCILPPGYVENPDDCDDNDPNINPDAEELCDSLDNNCNGEIDEGSCVPNLIEFYHDDCVSYDTTPHMIQGSIFNSWQCYNFYTLKFQYTLDPTKKYYVKVDHDIALGRTHNMNADGYLIYDYTNEDIVGPIQIPPESYTDGVVTLSIDGSTSPDNAAIQDIWIYEEISPCTGDVDEDCDLDVFDLVFINRHLQGFPIIVPTLWRQMNPNIPLDSEISTTIEECKADYNIDTRGELDVFDLVIINRYLQGFTIIVPSLWRQLYPEIPPDTEIAQAVEALKPTCPLPKIRKKDLIRYYDGSGGTGQLGINNLSASGGDQGLRVPVYLDTNDNLFSITFDIRFDPNKLEATALEKNDTRVKVSLGSDAIDNTTGRIIVNILDMTGQTAVTAGEGKILDIVFNVKTTACDNTTLFVENIRSIYSTTGSTVNLSTQNGTLSLPSCNGPTVNLLSISNTTAEGGAQGVRVPVNLNIDVDLFSITFDINFDPTKLEATALEKNDTRVKVSLGSDAIDNTTGRIIVNILDMTGQTAVTAGEGKILDIVFNVKISPQTDQDTTLALQNLRSVYSVTGQTPAIQLQNGIFTISGEGEKVDCYRDADTDTYGDHANSILADGTCPQGYVEDDTDCDDTDKNTYPGAPEICDGKDNDCDDTIDEPGAQGCTTYYKDQDNDTYGITTDTLCLCNPQGTYTATRGGDPDDTDPNVPGISPCQFIANIAAQGQNIPGAENISTVIIGIDYDPYSYPAPPTPPPDYTVYMTIAGQYSEDVRPTDEETQEWELSLIVGDKADPNTNGFFPSLNWDPDELCHTDPDLQYTFKLYSKDTQGVRRLLVSDMILTDHYQTKQEDGECYGRNCTFTYLIEWSKSVTIDMNFQAGWSMISLPVISDNAEVPTLFPGAVVAYGYEKGKGYVRVQEGEELQPGHGYWILFNEDMKYKITGQPIHSYTRTFYEDGWYMTGGCTDYSLPSADSCSIIVMYRYVKGFGYKRVLETENLEPGGGFWMLLEGITDQCRITVEPAGPLSRLRAGILSSPEEDNWPLSIIAQERALSIAEEATDIDKEYPSSPPPPPGSSIVLKAREEEEKLITVIKIPEYPYAPDINRTDENNTEEGHCSFIAELMATGQTQTAEVEMGIDPTSAATIIDPCNWSTDNIIRLQLIDSEADLKDLTDEDYLIFDVRNSLTSQDFWYVLLETSTGIDQPESYPVLKWNPDELVCSCSDNNEYVYQLRRGLGGSGKLLCDMTQTDLYQTLPQDGKTTLYFTIIRKEKETVSEIQNPGGHILPWSGVFPGAFGWPSFPATGGFPGNLPFQATTGYPPGIGKAVFPWTLPGYASIEYLYLGWRTAYDFPFSFTGAGLFPKAENNTSGLYRTGFSGIDDIPLVYWYYPNP